MKIVKFDNPSVGEQLLPQLVAVLEEGGLVCVPCQGSYRLLADLNNESAVTHLFQSKRRVQKAPSLVFVGKSMLHRVAENVDPVAIKLARAFWPGSLTILFDANTELPTKSVKQLTKYNKKIGVRMPSEQLLLQLVNQFGGPLLVSSANKESKQGASSPAQVRKNFVGRVDLFLDAGDLPTGLKSTVVRVEDGHIEVVREGAIDADEIRQAVEEAD